MPPTTAKVKVGSTGSTPELVDRIPIAAAAKPGVKRTVVLSLGPNDPKTDLPLPDMRSGDRLRLFAELEVTTDYEDPKATGLIGSAYGYTPRIEARLLVAKSATATQAKSGRAIEVGPPWRGECSHDHHHRVIVFGDRGIAVDDLDWRGPYFINVVLSAAHPKAKRSDRLLVGQNEPTPVVGRDMAGIRVVRLRPGTQPAQPTQATRRALVRGIPVNQREVTDKQSVVVYSHQLSGLRKGEQLLVKGRLVTDAGPLGYPARVSTRLFLAESPQQTEPGGEAQTIATWNGHLSKMNGFNCLANEGPQTTQKFGVLELKKAATKPLFVNLVAVSSEPLGGATAGDKLPVGAGGFVEITRYPTASNG